MIYMIGGMGGVGGGSDGDGDGAGDGVELRVKLGVEQDWIESEQNRTDWIGSDQM